MHQLPDGLTLLECVHKTLRDEVLPTMPPDQRHVMLMLINAVQIAQRQFENGSRAQADELAGLRVLLGDEWIEANTANRELSSRIRSGAADPGAPERDAILRHLRLAGAQRLAESNPKVLQNKAVPRA